MIDNSKAKVIFITSFENYIRVKLKLLRFLNRANVLTLPYCYAEIKENLSTPSHLGSQTKWRLGVAGNMIRVPFNIFFRHGTFLVSK